MSHLFIQNLKDILHRPERQVVAAGAFMGFVSAAALAAAFISQYGFGLQPCVLCIYQRVPFAVVIALAVLGPFLKRPRLVLAAMGLCFAAGAAIAGFHAGVEQKWWTGTDACGLSLDTADLETLRQQIMNAPRARCDEIPWSLFGISMAGYNFMISSILAIASLYIAQSATPDTGD